MLMHRLYIMSKLNLRKSHGVMNNCNPADVNPDTANEYPISSAGLESPPEAIGEKQNKTYTTSKAEAKKAKHPPERHKALMRGLESSFLTFAVEGGERRFDVTLGIGVNSIEFFSDVVLCCCSGCFRVNRISGWVYLKHKRSKSDG